MHICFSDLVLLPIGWGPGKGLQITKLADGETEAQRREWLAFACLVEAVLGVELDPKSSDTQPGLPGMCAWSVYL